MPQNKFVTLNDILEELRNLSGSELSAPLVVLDEDEDKVLRYVSEWGLHQSLNEDEGFQGFSPNIKTSRFVFRLGDVVDD